MKENYPNYEAPTVEVMEIAVEQGFANSSTNGGTSPWYETPGEW